MSAILKTDFQKKKTITFFRRKLAKLHKKDIMYACDNITLSQKQGETRASNGLITYTAFSW